MKRCWVASVPLKSEPTMVSIRTISSKFSGEFAPRLAEMTPVTASSWMMGTAT